ncbi:hypothetical protein IPdc08_00572 [archaeon]|nr:hypothetical protein IPdc08_00572 [archaeon]
MKIGEALARKKLLKNKLLELQKLQRTTFFVEEGKKKEADFDELSGEISKVLEELRELKLKTQNANLKTFVDWNAKNISLAEAILNIGDLRSQFAHLDKLEDDDRSFGNRSFYDRKTKDEVEYIPQKTRTEIVELKKKLEAEKTALDNLLQNTNWQVEI